MKFYHYCQLIENQMATPEQFYALADLQRGAAESAMLQVQFAMGGGVLNPLVEHVGDLIHRMTEKPTFEYAGYPYVKDKVHKCLHWLERDSSYITFREEFERNINNNAKFWKINPEDLLAKVKRALTKYAREHAKLPAYNQAQQLAKDAVAEIGKMNFEGAIPPLRELWKHLQTEEEWVKFAHEGLGQ